MIDIKWIFSSNQNSVQLKIDSFLSVLSSELLQFHLISSHLICYDATIITSY